MEGSCEYIESVANNRQGVFLQLGAWMWGLTAPYSKKSNFVTKCYTGPRTWADSLDKRPKLRINGLEIWRIEHEESLYGGFTDNREIAKCKLYLVGAQEVGWDRGGTKPASDYTFFYGKGNENHGNSASDIEGRR
jgi:hypothetical protein